MKGEEAAPGGGEHWGNSSQWDRKQTGLGRGQRPYGAV
jgi:hypothetical protein